LNARESTVGKVKIGTSREGVDKDEYDRREGINGLSLGRALDNALAWDSRYSFGSDNVVLLTTD
jgi:hypothetical protein